MFDLKQESLTQRLTPLEQKRFQDFLNSVGLILNSIQGHSAILCLKKEAVGLQVKEILCNQLIQNINLIAGKPHFGPNFGLSGPNLGLIFLGYCPKLQFCAMPGKTNDINLRKWPHFGPHLNSLGPNSGHQKFFIQLLVDIIHYTKQLDIIPSYHPMSFKRKLRTKLDNMAKHLIWSLILARLAQIWAKTFFVGLTCTRCQTLSQAIIEFNFMAKLKIQTQENGKMLHFGSDLGSLGPNSGC